MRLGLRAYQVVLEQAISPWYACVELQCAHAQPHTCAPTWCACRSASPRGPRNSSGSSHEFSRLLGPLHMRTHTGKNNLIEVTAAGNRSRNAIDLSMHLCGLNHVCLCSVTTGLLPKQSSHLSRVHWSSCDTTQSGCLESFFPKVTELVHLPGWDS